MKLTWTRLIIVFICALLVFAAYGLGRNGVDLAQVITESRCSAGAFMAHTPPDAAPKADSAPGQPVPASPAPRPPYGPANLTAGNIMPNGSLETLAGTKPAGWDSATSGENNGRFYVVPGHESATAVRTDITRYTSGAADWFGPVLTVTPGAYYQFQDYYRANVSTQPELMLRGPDGRTQYLSLDPLPAAAGWTLQTQRFFVPTDVTEIRVSHPLAQVGWLETDNYVLQGAAVPTYARGMVSVTFDDGWRTTFDQALPIMQRNHIVSTQYLVSGFLGTSDKYLSVDQVYALSRAGHEIASHTVDHPNLTTLSGTDLSYQLKRSQTDLTKCFGRVRAFAPPYGAADARTTPAQQSTYQTARSTLAGFNSPDALNPYQLKVQNLRADTTAGQLQAWLDTARANHVWLILVYHQVSDGAGEYARRPTDFDQDMRAVQASGLNVETISDAYLEATSQFVINGS